MSNQTLIGVSKQVEVISAEISAGGGDSTTPIEEGSVQWMMRVGTINPG